MNQSDLHTKRYRRVFFFVLFFAAAGASFNGFYTKWHLREAGTTQYIPRVSFEAMVDGTADRPFVYRQMLPMIANWIDARISIQTKSAIFSARNSSGVSVLNFIFDSPVTGDAVHLVRYTIVYFEVALFAWIAVCAMYFAATAAGQPPVSAALGSVAVILFMPYFFTVGGYFYDYPELAFFALAVGMSIKFDWWWMIPIAALGTWNKESFLFFIPTLYPLLRLRGSRMSAMAGTCVLGLTSASVYFLLRLRFRHNPGATVEIHLFEQIKAILNPSAWFSIDVTYGEVVFRGFNPFTLALVAGAFWCGWRHLSKPLQRHTQLAAIINVPLFLLFGFPGETRGLSMLYVSFLVLLAANTTSWTNQRTEVAVAQ